MCPCQVEAPKPLYSVPELATLTRLTRQQIGRLLKHDSVTTMRLGRKILVPLSCIKTAWPHIWDSILESRGFSPFAA